MSVREDKGIDINITQEDIDSIARVLLPDILSFYENDDNKKRFEQWLAERNRKIAS